MLMLSILSAVAWPCVSLYHTEKQLAESDAQSILFEPTDSGVSVSYLVNYTGDATDFGWLIPIYGEFTSLEEGDVSTFEDLHDLTQPRVEIVRDPSNNSGSGCNRPLSKDATLTAGGADTAMQNDAVVVAEGFAGSYAYQILDSSDSSAFFAWLDENGWAPNGAESVLEMYIEEGGIQFAAITLTEAAGDQLPPVTISHTGDQLRFPAAMARQAPVDTLRTILYVRADTTATITGEWSATALGTLNGAYDDSASRLYDEALLDVGDVQRGFGLVYSGPDDANGWVTRFEGLVQPSAHTADVFLDLSDAQTQQETSIVLSETFPDSAWLLLPLTVLGLGSLRRRRMD